jgi:hypothetical protein
MTRGEFWSEKLITADSISGTAFENTMNAVIAECVSSEIIDGVSVVKFSDGSWLKVHPVPVLGKLFGQVECGNS